MKTVGSIFHSPKRNHERRGSNNYNQHQHHRHDRSNSYSSPRKYFSRKFRSKLSWHELPLEKNALGLLTPAGIFFFLMRLTVPLAYIYISLILLKELSISFPKSIHPFLQSYIPPLHQIIQTMIYNDQHNPKRSIIIEIWVYVEAIFYIIQILHIRYLQYKDPLEASLSSAPIATLSERLRLMNQMMDQIVNDDPVEFIRGWFFNVELEDITRYDVMDFVSWSMFEGRHQEHLTDGEVGQMNWFVRELECRIGVFLYGEMECNDNENEDDNDDDIMKDNHDVYIDNSNELKLDVDLHGLTHRRQRRSGDYFNDHDDDDYNNDYGFFLKTNSFNTSPILSPNQRLHHVRPKKDFQFLETSHDTTPSFFTNLYENYVQTHQQYKHLQDTGMKSVQNIRNFVANKRQQLVEAEEHAMAAASNIYENASNMYESAYNKFVHKGSSFDKRINAISNATHQQLNDAWDSIGNMKEKFETARIVASRKKFLQQQHRGYRMLLERIIHSSSVPPPQMVDLMKKITQCNESLEAIEDSAMDSFLKVTGFAKKHLLQQKDPCRYAKYSSDELIGLAVYPLAFNLAILGVTDGLLRFVMARRGFERLNLGTMVYYYHPGPTSISDNEEDVDKDDHPITPIVFCHGIGIGLGYYMALIDELLKLGRPLFLPEIPYVCGFRPWISRKSILTPPVVVSTLTAMLASHGHIKASFVGHSYGTSWVSFMCKYARHTMASVLFLDPICFCLHHPCLTKSFVYHRADPGSVSYMVKTDVIVNWTIQRAFPWARIILFVEDIPDIPCSIYVSEHDVLIPIDAVQKYLKSKGAHFCDENDASSDHFRKGPINVTVLRGDAHGDWTLRATTSKKIVDTARVLTEQYESKLGN